VIFYSRRFSEPTIGLVCYKNAYTSNKLKLLQRILFCFVAVPVTPVMKTTSLHVCSATFCLGIKQEMESTATLSMQLFLRCIVLSHMWERFNVGVVFLLFYKLQQLTRIILNRGSKGGAEIAGVDIAAPSSWGGHRESGH